MEPGLKHELERGDCAVIAFLVQMNTGYEAHVNEKCDKESACERRRYVFGKPDCTRSRA
jgi:hypothetical protein